MKNNIKENEDLDIIILFEKIKLMLVTFFLKTFRVIKLFANRWKQLLAISFIGILLGYFLTDKETPKQQEAAVLVKINFDAGNFVYDSIDLINLKIQTDDDNFFNEEVLLNEAENIDEVSINPIIDIKDIVDEAIKANEIRVLFENLQYEDGLSVTDGFRSDYDYHLIKIIVSSDSSIETVKKLINYFNNNPLFEELKNRNSQRILSAIYENEQTIVQIDKILNHYTDQREINTSQLYIDNKNIRPNELIKTKIQLQKENQDLKNEMLTSKETVMMINESNMLIEKRSLLSNKMIFYPFLFLLIYFAASVMFGLYSYLDKLDRAS